MTASASPLRLRRDLNLGTTWLLPEWSSGPVGPESTVLAAARDAGYQGIQGADPQLCRDLGLVPITFDICPEPGDLGDKPLRWADQGFACATLMMGSGFEDDDTLDRLADELLTASAAAHLPLYLETHRATMTQDIWRTLRLIERFPELRFNGDFSHWYTGHDLAIGDFAAKVELLAPVLDRVRYLHGRIATPGCIQVDLGPDGTGHAEAVGHFRTLWTRAFTGALATAGSDVVPVPESGIGFAPELLPAEFGYALQVPDAEGVVAETGDRWDQALVLSRIAEACFEAAAGLVS